MNFVDFQSLKCISAGWRIKKFTGESVSYERIEDRFYNPVKESLGRFSNRNLEVFGILEIILHCCYILLVLL